MFVSFFTRTWTCSATYATDEEKYQYAVQCNAVRCGASAASACNKVFSRRLMMALAQECWAAVGGLINRGLSLLSIVSLTAATTWLV